MLRRAPTTIAALLLAAGGTLAQTTVPFWSGYFSGSDRDEIVAIRRGPGNLITLVGHTRSGDLQGTSAPGVLYPTNAGGNDVFVARLDPGLPPAQQVLWCTYLGGSDLELAFDAEVDPQNGVTTVVGLSLSTDFPGPSGPLARNGPSDGFVAQIDANGAVLLGAMFVGGGGHDRLCEVEIEPGTLQVTVAGVTEQQLPTAWTLGTVGPTYRGGGTDAFVARVDAIAPQVLWATHLGGSSTEGIAFANWGGLGVAWEGNLDRMAMTLDPVGRPVLATVSFTATGLAVTTPNAIQTLPAGTSDVYLAVVNLPGPPPAQLHYGTYLGGATDDRPRAIARHPGGGFVIGGLTLSGDFRVTLGCYDPVFDGGPLGLACDGFVSHVDPAFSGLAGLRYSTFLGGDAGEDAVGGIAVESSGRVTVAGYSAGGNFTTTPRCMQPTSASPQFLGFVCRLQLASQSAGDLLYATYVDFALGSGTTVFNSLVLDENGDALVAGGSNSTAYPWQSPPTPMVTGGRDGVFTHLPLLPGGTFRDAIPWQNPACGAPLHTGAGLAPVPGVTFTITATNAPPNGLGVLVLGDPIAPVPLPPPFSGTLLASVSAPQTVFADALGAAWFGLAVPGTVVAPANWGLAAQWFFFTTAGCPGSGMLANSERLNF